MVGDKVKDKVFRIVLSFLNEIFEVLLEFILSLLLVIKFFI